MTQMRDKQEIMVATRFYNKAILPLFNALGWKARRHTDPPEGTTIIMDVCETNGQSESVARSKLVEVIQSLPGALEGMPIHTLPSREGVRWGAFAQISTVLADLGRSDLAEEVWGVLKTVPNDALPGFLDLGTAEFTPFRDGSDWSQRYAPGKSDWRKPSLIPRSERERAEVEQEPAKDIFDYERYRRDPEQAAILANYLTGNLIVKASDMIARGKTVFEAKGWIYSGEHYGNGDLSIQIVLDKDDKIVPLPVVMDVLHNVSIQNRGADGWDDETVEEDNDYVPLEDVPKILTEEEADRRYEEEAAVEAEEAEIAEAAVEAEEEGKPAALILKDGEHLGLVVDYASDTEIAEITLHIGDNVIPVQCNLPQAMQFMTDAALIGSGTLNGLGGIMLNTLLNYKRAEKETEEHED